MCECKNCSYVFDDSLCDSEITICPRCRCDADRDVDREVRDLPWSPEWERQMEAAHEDLCGFGVDLSD